jgi:hypothetical protein
VGKSGQRTAVNQPLQPPQKAKSARRAVRRSDAQRAAQALPLALEVERNQQANYYGEQAQTFDQSRYNQHGRLDFARSFWLAADGLHRATTDTTDTQAYTQSNQTSTNSGTKYSQTRRIRNGLQQERKKHKKKLVGSEKQKSWGEED